MSNENYLINLYLDTHFEDYITGIDAEGKYQVCNGCKRKIYEHDTRLPLEDWCNECMYGYEDEEE